MDEPISLRWSDTFAILPPSDPICSKLPGDKIILPPSALQQLLSASSSRAATGSANGSNGYFGSSYLSSQSYGQETQQLPNPLIFRLVNPKNHNVVYAGIREFSAPEGTIGLSSLLLEALAIGSDDYVQTTPDVIDIEDPESLESKNAASGSSRITVHAVELQKGTYVRLRPLEAGYNPDDWKPLLERQLRQNFTTLTKNTVIPVQGSQGEHFKLLVDKFAPDGDGICVIDTDLEVDIEALNEEQARETMRQIIAQGQSGASSGSSKGVCRNVNCGRTLYGVGSKGQIGTAGSQVKAPGNDIGLCSLCFGPLYVSMHDPDGKALRRRIERRYLSQLMAGCGKPHCANEWCKTGRSNTGLEAKGSSAAAALPLVKPFLPGALDASQPCHFCVDESSQTGRKLAELVAAEKVWDLEWCVAAAENEKANLDKMRDWLQAWAPRR
ncbi:hypothetical protein TrVFT333_003900 [Trichoderma virens FT-333]|nr:hypothetical protein TrVFT333_003900 [Trichoderma virens FT-333]